MFMNELQANNMEPECNIVSQPGQLFPIVNFTRADIMKGGQLMKNTNEIIALMCRTSLALFNRTSSAFNTGTRLTVGRYDGTRLGTALTTSWFADLQGFVIVLPFLLEGPASSLETVCDPLWPVTASVECPTSEVPGALVSSVSEPYVLLSLCTFPKTL